MYFIYSTFRYLLYLIPLLFTTISQAQDIVGLTNSLVLFKLELKDGKIQYLNHLDVFMFDIAVTPSGKLFGTSQNSIYEIDKSTGISKVVFTCDFSTGNSLMAIDEHHLILMGRDDEKTFLAKIDVREECLVEQLGILPVAYYPAGDITWMNGSFYLSDTKNSLVRISIPENPNDSLICERLATLSTAPWAMFNAGKCESKLYGFSAGALMEYDPTTGNENVLIPNLLNEMVLGSSVSNEYSTVQSMDVFTPNLVTANNDGINDLFESVASTKSLKKMEIYNSWGSLVYEEISVNPSWNGITKGSSGQDGIYYYSISDLECEVKPRVGYVQFVH